jgi:uncharacterized repeat protein (TIGR03803 family)
MKPWSHLCTALPLLLLLACAIASPAQSFNTLLSFDGSDGEFPAYLVQGLDGNIYGTTSGGGAHSNGTIFKITPAGTLTTLYSFCIQTNCPDGRSPYALVLATNGNFYGTTTYGGGIDGCYTEDLSCGTVFKITPSGTLTTLHRFDGNDGGNPSGGLVQAANGTFYGTTSQGGISSSNCGGGCGTIFKITPSGTLTTLYSFCKQTNCPDDAFPRGLVLATNGNFYGTTAGVSGNCSSGGCGTVFKITPSGTLTTLHRFDGTDGSEPYVGLVQGTDGNLYGVTLGGGANGDGTVFKITLSGTLTTLHSFDVSDGESPDAILVQGTDGNLFGTTPFGGSGNCSNGCGTVFKITPSGTFTTQHSFDGTDGSSAQAGLVQATNGAFYGATSSGGSSSNCSDGCGTVFSLSVGLAPFVETLPTSGKVETTVKILGKNLRRATGVSFNGTAATFNVVSNSYIKTSVPNGATTGFVTVATPSRTLKSSKKFRVIP